MARLSGVCTGHKLAAKQQTEVALLGRYITLIYQHLARLWPAYLLRHGPFLARLVFSNEKAWEHCVYMRSSLWVSRTGSASDWCALQESLYKCIDTIQYVTVIVISSFYSTSVYKRY